MTVFHLVRHASHDLLGRALVGRTTDIGLNAQGRAEAAAVAKRLSGGRVAAVCASPLRRTVETARPIAVSAGVNLLLEPRLIEIDFGTWSGMSFDALAGDPDWGRWNDFRAGVRAPGGETLIEAQARIVSAMIDMRDRFGEAELVLLSHGDVIKAALGYWAGIPVDLLRRVDLPPASLSFVRLEAGSVSISGINL
jgi:broad specificity phosphatase PhoE